MQLAHLIADLKTTSITGEVSGVEVKGIAFDSRKVKPGYVFVAVRGTQVDGHDYLEQAAENGARTFVVDAAVSFSDGEGMGKRLEDDGVVIRVANTPQSLAQLASAHHHHPSHDLTLVGVTGTNGKTTVCTLLHELFTGLGYRAGLLSTVELRIGKERQTATHTTPDALAIHAKLAAMRDAGCDYVFMEVSSHAVDQQRTYGLDFDGGIFTNLSHDHLDYHETFAAYLTAKKTFFDRLKREAFALVNVDDKRGEVMLQNTRAKKYRYSLRKVTDFRARILANTPQGLQLDVDGTEVFTRILGRFNAYNFLGAYAGASLLGGAKEEVLTVLSQLSGASGRMEQVGDPAGKITALVDYAHTPDALANVLDTLRSIVPPGGKILCVVGAGGDRDRAKRPEMARIGASLADQLILTTDNPRNEDPAAILDAMETGVSPELATRVLRIQDRRSAIKTAVRLASPGDIVLVAGKGHENYQEVRGERLPFDDKEELATALKNASHAH